MPSLRVNGQSYFYEQCGDGPHLVLLHGFTGSGEGWRDCAGRLADHFSVTMIDILGHGRSAAPVDPARYAITAVSQDIISICHRLGMGQFHLLGYSMGGRLALATAVYHPNPIQSLILESSSPGLKTAVDRQKRILQDNQLADSIEADGIEAFVDHWERLSLWESQTQLDPEKRLALRQRRLKNSPAGLANSLRGMGTGAQPNLWSQLAALRCPTLQIVGELDPKFVAINQEMVQRLPNSRLKIISQAGHTVHLERPLLFETAVIAFYG